MAKRVLVVEDDPDAARTYAEMLSSGGFLVESAGNGKEAVVKANEFEPDLVLIDIGLPDGNGLLLARTLGMLHEVPVVMVTGMPSFELQEPMSANPYIQSILFKPCSSRTLIASIEEALNGAVIPET